MPFSVAPHARAAADFQPSSNTPGQLSRIVTVALAVIGTLLVTAGVLALFFVAPISLGIALVAVGGVSLLGVAYRASCCAAKQQIRPMSDVALRDAELQRQRKNFEDESATRARILDLEAVLNAPDERPPLASDGLDVVDFSVEESVVPKRAAEQAAAAQLALEQQAEAARLLEIEQLARPALGQDPAESKEVEEVPIGLEAAVVVLDKLGNRTEFNLNTFKIVGNREFSLEEQTEFESVCDLTLTDDQGVQYEGVRYVTTGKIVQYMWGVLGEDPCAYSPQDVLIFEKKYNQINVGF